MATQQVNIITNLSTVLKVPVRVLNVLLEKESLCIGSAIHDAKLQNEPAVVLNIGIGSLSIDLKDFQCKFIPSKELKSTIRQSLDGKIDPLEQELEIEIAEKLMKICDEVM